MCGNLKYTGFQYIEKRSVSSASKSEVETTPIHDFFTESKCLQQETKCYIGVSGKDGKMGFMAFTPVTFSDNSESKV